MVFYDGSKNNLYHFPEKVIIKNKFSDSQDEDDYELYYNGCCNGTFWPLFHSMPDKAVFSEKFWVAYRSVNSR